ncbi:hypothetical protein [Cognatiyoonia koreensis]|uniref:hypothetical protein n=1 Tax=Cognatiyoonia koreensis TaxID=364200 RepID=UPI001F6057B4|nr:hypothetical protein [Cognatiyoonia koreensis]
MDTVVPEDDGSPADDILPCETLARVRAGDIWALGQHRLICGDALDVRIVADLMHGEEAVMVFTDPPYNVPIDGHVGNSGKIQHREFAMASGEMSALEFTSFLERASRQT